MRRRPGGRELFRFLRPTLRDGRIQVEQNVHNHDPIRDQAGSGRRWFSHLQRCTHRRVPLSVLQKDVVAPELVTQCLNQVVGRVDSPTFTELQQSPGISAGVLQRNRTGAAMTTANIG